MGTLLYNPTLEIEYRWTVAGAWQTWKTCESTRRSPPFSISLLPRTTFHILMFTGETDNEIEWAVTCNDKNLEDDFEYYLWKGKEKIAIGSEKHIVETDTRYDFVDLSHSNEFCCKVVYKYCRTWVVQKLEKMNQLAENANRLAKRFERKFNVQTAKVEVITEQRDILAARLLYAKEEGEIWKENAQEQKQETDNLNAQLQSLLDNQSSNDISKALWQLQKEGKLTDFWLYVDDKSIEVHKIVLAVNSPLFAQMFEKHPENTKYVISGTSFEVVKQMVAFFLPWQS
ncbi:hypothetical protein M3Y94_00043600 [Aphelenchoides besseyi]|nr:hypothetical protein M3Y94_00043600 [Aphelenchoides besseyi]